MFEGFDERVVDVAADVRIHCVVAGSGPPVLLLHGYPQTLALWAGVAPALAERFTVVCADLRGYGDSAKPMGAADSSNYSFRVMAGDQVTLMHRLGFERFHVVGHDRGGRTGHRLDLDHPGKVESLAVLDIAPTHTMFMETNRHGAAAYWHWYFLSLPAPFPERMIGADLAHDEADIGRTVDCPALAPWGPAGFMHHCFDMAALWHERCSNPRTETLPGAHFFADQFPKETAAILADFLGS